MFYKFVKGIIMGIYVWSGSYRQMHNLHVTVETDLDMISGSILLLRLGYCL